MLIVVALIVPLQNGIRPRLGGVDVRCVRSGGCGACKRCRAPDHHEVASHSDYDLTFFDLADEAAFFRHSEGVARNDDRTPFQQSFFFRVNGADNRSECGVDIFLRTDAVTLIVDRTSHRCSNFAGKGEIACKPA
jgi:hypothetical protein